jgi:hypothetical protein
MLMLYRGGATLADSDVRWPRFGHVQSSFVEEAKFELTCENV